MSSTQYIFIGAGLFFLFIFFSGFWLSRSGKPYGTAIFTTHKLVGLVAGGFLVMTVYRVYQEGIFLPIQIAAIAITLFLFILIVAAGGLLSTEKQMPLVVTLVHRILPYLTALSTGGTLYLLLV